MNRFKNLLLVLPILLGSASMEPSEMSGNRIVHNNKDSGKQALLEYTGSVSGMVAYNIGIQVAIDTTIGVRYEVTFERGTAVMSHVALFYKFSSPYQSVLYNFLTHKSIVKNGGSPDSDANVDVIGNETVDTYLCTHLQHGGGTHDVDDYWMSPNVPGFSKLINTLKTISPGLPALAFSGTVFNWGGLVKMTKNAVEQNGETMNAELHLQEANTDITLPSSTFDVPSK